MDKEDLLVDDEMNRTLIRNDDGNMSDTLLLVGGDKKYPFNKDDATVFLEKITPTFSLV